MWKDSETNVDFLDFEYLKKILIAIVNDDTLSPSSIGVYGDWGSGKSSLMKMCIEELSQEENVLCVSFNGWLFEGYEDAKTALLGTILDSIKKKEGLKEKALETIKRLYKNTDKLKLASQGIKYGIDLFATGGIGTLADITVKSVLAATKDKAANISESDIRGVLSDGSNSKDIRDSIGTFHADFSQLLNESEITKLIVFIDELDRCSPDTILDTLEAIRLFLFAKNTSFVIGADERHVRYAVQKKFSEIEGNQLDIGKEYLEKLIQYPVRIPQMSQKEIEFYIMCLFFQKELDAKGFGQVLDLIKKEKQGDFINFILTYDKLEKKLPDIAAKSREIISIAKQLSSVLAVGLNGNPRHCKRFLNSLSMREKMANLRGVELDRKVLAKVMLLEYFQSDFFKKIAGIQLANKGALKELKAIEDDNWGNVKELELWKDNSWIQDWAKIAPKIGEIDLQPYFYFARESLASQLNLAQLRLSPVAEGVLTDLLNGSDSSRIKALKKANEVNDFEANIILNKISEEITLSPKIKANILRSLLEWGVSKESLYTGTVSCLDKITGDKLSLGAIPRVKAFMDKSGKEAEIKAIADRWKAEKAALTKAIDSNF